MKKGFTLVELLAVIVILGVIALITVVSVNNILSDSKDSLSATQKHNVEEAAKAYYLKEGMDEEDTCISISELISKGYIEAKEVKDPKTKENLEGYVKITVPSTSEFNQYTYEYQEISCESLVEYITNLYSPNSTVTNNSITYNVDTTNGIIDDGLGGTVSSGGNLRYYGASPNNYIDIGDRDSSGNIILWRIIGVFETKYATDELPCNTDSDSDGHYDNCASEKLVKIIRDESIGDYIWDDTTSGSYDNNWNDSTLQILLNDAYYNASTTSYYNNSTTAITLDLTGKGLSATARSKVENVLWNLGGTSSPSNLYSNDFYSYERGITVYSGHATEWVGKIGLMYPSDYGYATDLGSCSDTLYKYSSSTSSYACRTNDWLFDSSISQCTISPKSSYSDYVFYVYSSGDVFNSNAFDSFGARPVLYLKSDVSIVDTKTTSDGISYYVVE